MSYQLAICRFPGGGAEHPRSSGYVMRLIQAIARKSYPGLDLDSLMFQTHSDTPITMTRNLAVKNSLAQGADYILMIDSDMDPDLYCEGGTQALIDGAPHEHARPFFDAAWQAMIHRRTEEDLFLVEHQDEQGRLKPDVPDEVRQMWFARYAPATIAAPYCGPCPGEVCFVFEWKDTGHGDEGFRLEQIERSASAIRSGIQEVAALPTGLILYDARLFKALLKPWYAYEYEDPECTRKATTEDVYQTRNANCMGFPQFVAWDSWAGHIKPKTVGKPRLLTPQIMSGIMQKALRAPDEGTRAIFDDHVPKQAYIDPEEVPCPIPPLIRDDPTLQARLETQCVLPRVTPAQKIGMALARSRDPEFVHLCNWIDSTLPDGAGANIDGFSFDAIKSEGHQRGMGGNELYCWTVQEMATRILQKRADTALCPVDVAVLDTEVA